MLRGRRGRLEVVYDRRVPGAAARARTLLRQAERLAAALDRILGPAPAPSGPAVRLLLDDRGGERPVGGLRVASAAAGVPASLWQISLTLTREFVARRFGEKALSLRPLVEGVAGLAAARARQGHPVREADEWVRGEMDGGRRVSLAGYMGAPAEQLPAATSFVAYLVGLYGVPALREALASHDPVRPDHGAVTAFHQPLGVLEEGWLTSLRRRASHRDGLWSLVRRITPLLRPYGWARIEILLYLVVAAASNVAVPIATKWYLNHFDRVIKERGSLLGATHGYYAGGALSPDDAARFLQHTLVPFVLVLLAVQVAAGLVSLRRSYVVAWLNQQVLNGLQERLFSHLQRLPHRFFDRAKVGDLMSRLTSDVETIQQALAQLTNKGLYNAFTLVGGVVALFYTMSGDPSLALLTLTLVPAFAFTYAALRARNKQASREQRARVGQTAAFTQEHLAAHSVIKAFGMEARVVAAFRQRLLVQQASKLRLSLLSALSDLTEDMTTAIAQIVIFGLGGYMVLHDTTGRLGVGDLAAALMVVKVVFGPIANLSGIGQTVQQASGALQRVNELFAEPAQIADAEGAAPLPAVRNEIRLENVTFAYEAGRPALDGIDLSVPAGSHAAIVGPSGSGKSTIVSLLMRFYDPDEGGVRFDGHDLRTVTLASLREQIGLVQQDTIVFDTTIRENLRIGCPDADEGMVRAAASAARLDEVIESMPAGYDTVVGERGVRMSGGQRQRLAIARAILRDPRVLLLDEATSALDTGTEAELMETLIELSRGRTTISVTHRLSWARRADIIFVLDHGRLVERGTHDELMRLGGLYHRLYEEQTRDLAPQSAPHEAEPDAWAGPMPPHVRLHAA